MARVVVMLLRWGISTLLGFVWDFMWKKYLREPVMGTLKKVWAKIKAVFKAVYSKVVQYIKGFFTEGL